jgi:hypothetical protein
MCVQHQQRCASQVFGSWCLVLGFVPVLYIPHNSSQQECAYVSKSGATDDDDAAAAAALLVMVLLLRMVLLLTMVLLLLLILQSEDQGIEDLTVEFPPSSYKGHFNEDGYNAVFFTSTTHCFARNLRTVNAGGQTLIHTLHRKDRI